MLGYTKSRFEAAVLQRCTMAKAAAFLAGAASALLAVWLRQRQRRHFLSGQELKKKSLRDGHQLVLRGATLADVEAVFELCVRRLAIEHDALDELQTTVEAFAQAFAAGKFHLLVAEIDGALAGAATYQYSYRTGVARASTCRICTWRRRTAARASGRS